jgi:hypothetical protein
VEILHNGRPVAEPGDKKEGEAGGGGVEPAAAGEIGVEKK